MEEISNKTIAVLLMAAIVVSLGGTLITLNKLTQPGFTGVSGLAGSNTTGQASVEVIEITEISFVDDTVDFGSGFVADTCSYCEMVSNGTRDEACCEGAGTGNLWNDTANYQDGLLLRNDGNYNMSLQLNSSTNATEMFGNNANASFQFRAVAGFDSDHPGSDDTVNSCNSGFISGWQNLTQGTPLNLCGAPGTDYDFLYSSSEDEVELEIRVQIPDDAPKQANTATIYVIGESPQ
ncbi:MAG: hypothetical protein R6V53_01180 [Candidatus Woesearchaeota archaeon]